MSFDLSLARGLDYYTGIIYEAITEASAPPSFVASDTAALPASEPAKAKAPKKDDEEEEFDESTVGVGSIAAGGRYDNLVGMFSTAAGSAKKDKGIVPCVGVSVGVERVYAILMAREAEKQKQSGKSSRGKETEVYVMSVGDGLVKERMQLCKELWENGIKVGGLLAHIFSVYVYFGLCSSQVPILLFPFPTAGRVHVQGQAQVAAPV